MLLWGAIMLVGFVLLGVTMLITRGQSLLNGMYSQKTDTFYDFTVSVLNANNRHEYGGMYPPLAQLFFYVISRITPLADMESIFVFINSPLGAIYTLFFLMGCVILIYWLLENHLQTPSWAIKLIFVLIIFSSPFIYALQRGNVLLICLPLILFYVFNYDSRNKAVQIASLIALACAAGIKLYPAILGLMLAKERRWKQAWTCVGFGIGAVVVPAFFFSGIDTLMVVANRLFATSESYGERGVGHQLGFQNAIEMYNDAFGLNLNESICWLAMVLLMVFAFLLAKKKWQQLAILCTAMIIWPSLSFQYTMILLIPALILFLNETEKLNIWDVVYCILFAGCFVVIPFGGKNAFAFTEGQYYTLNIGTFVENISINLLMFTISIEVFFKSILSVKEKFFNVAR